MTVQEVLDRLKGVGPDVCICVDCESSLSIENRFPYSTFDLKSIEITCDIHGTPIEVVLHT
jgi:hypothetical protein